MFARILIENYSVNTLHMCGVHCMPCRGSSTYTSVELKIAVNVWVWMWQKDVLCVNQTIRLDVRWSTDWAVEQGQTAKKRRHSERERGRPNKTKPWTWREKNALSQVRYREKRDPLRRGLWTMTASLFTLHTFYGIFNEKNNISQDLYLIKTQTHMPSTQRFRRVLLWFFWVLSLSLSLLWLDFYYPHGSLSPQIKTSSKMSAHFSVN